jgi:hypothetical protein
VREFIKGFASMFSELDWYAVGRGTAYTCLMLLGVVGFMVVAYGITLFVLVLP